MYRCQTLSLFPEYLSVRRTLETLFAWIWDLRLASEWSEGELPYFLFRTFPQSFWTPVIYDNVFHNDKSNY
jgi:hypothetical protein